MTSENRDDLTISKCTQRDQNTSESVSHVYDLSVPFGITIISLTTIPIFVNILYIVGCVRTLKDNIHSLLVLSLCVSDAVMSLSFGIFVLSLTVSSIGRNIILCLFTLTSLLFSILSTYCVILLISIERYLVVRSRNFGIRGRLDRIKYRLIFGSFAIALSVTLMIMFLNPHQSSIETCTSPNLFGQSYGTVALLIGVLTTMLMFCSVTFTSLTSFQLWKVFFKTNQVGPVLKTVNLKRNTKSKGGNNTTDHTASVSQNVIIEMAEIDVNVVDFENKYSEGETTDTAKSKVEQSISEISNDTSFNVINIQLGKTISPDNETTDETIKHSREITDERTNQCPKQVKIGNSKNSTIDSKQRAAWETRAFVTSIIVATTTFALTGPFIASFWYDVFSDTLMPVKGRTITFILVTVNSVVNPFIYAWRLPEIREAFCSFLRPLCSCFKL